MKGRDEKRARLIAAAIRAVEFEACLTETRRVMADVEAVGASGPRIEVRHPVACSYGVQLLVAVVSLTGAPEVTYALPAYRDAIERTVASACARHEELEGTR